MSNLVTGIITAPRVPYYLGVSLDSYFDEVVYKPTVFAEPGCPVAYPNRSKVKLVTSLTKQGIIENWINALIYLRNVSTVDWIMICEDDVHWRGGSGQRLLDFLETLDQESTGFVSPYCCKLNGPGQPGWQHPTWNTGSLFGALTLCLPRPTVEFVLDHLNSLRTLAKGRDLDFAVGELLLRNGYKCYVHAPSLVTHLGIVSTLWTPNAVEVHSDARSPYEQCDLDYDAANGRGQANQSGGANPRPEDTWR